MDLVAKGDSDHVIALFKRGGCWGAISKSNHVWLRWRDPVYQSPRELAMSYFHEYNNRGRKTLRTYSDLQHYVEQSTEALVQSLRNEKGRAYRQQQVKAAVRFCEVLFGTDYASLMSRAAENAVTGERKATKATKAS